MMKLRTPLKMVLAIPMYPASLCQFLLVSLNPFLWVMKPIFMSLPQEWKLVSLPISMFSPSSSCFPPADPFSIGFADARLQCKFPSSATFSTWALAMAHYTEFFIDGSITIQPSQSSIKGPAQKKRCPNLPASTPKASGKVRSTFESPYSPLLFPDSPPPEHNVNRQKRPRSSCELQFPKYPVNCQKHPLTRSEVRAWKALAPSLSTEAPLLSPFTSRAQPAHVHI